MPSPRADIDARGAEQVKQKSDPRVAFLMAPAGLFLVSYRS
jgi:hypothetical protein